MTDQTAAALDAPAAIELSPHAALGMLWEWVNSIATVITEEKIGEITQLEEVIHRGLDAVATVEKQRDFLGVQVSSWIGRFYGLKVANGELAPGALPHVVANEVGALEQGCGRIAQEASGNGR